MDLENRPVIFYVTEKGKVLAEGLLKVFPFARVLRLEKGLVAREWKNTHGLVFIMATGIVVRTIKDFISNKYEDPGIVVVDEEGRNCISLLSGHLGGGNGLARKISEALGAQAVITTATDLMGLEAPDALAARLGMEVENKEALKDVAKILLKQRFLRVYCAHKTLDLPSHYLCVQDPKEADLVIDYRIGEYPKDIPLLRPRVLAVGVGFNKDTKMEELREAISQVFKKNHLSLNSIHVIATLEKKAKDPEFLSLARVLGVQVRYFTADQLNKVAEPDPKSTAFQKVGAYGVCEPSAILASRGGEVLVPKVRLGNVTVAVALIKEGEGRKRGRLSVVGIGPGDREELTFRARQALYESDLIVGYGTYLKQVQEIINGKETINTPMTREVERCLIAIKEAFSGKRVSLISGGDPGIYGMAGLVLELMAKEGPLDEIDLEIIPGVPALSACASRLGAPIMHDFAAISLSDRLTSWEKIEKRLKAASEADMVIVLYNPRSKGRSEHLKRALQIIGESRDPDTPVGIVKAATRQNEKILITTLKKVPVEEVDMETTLIVGNSTTFVWNGKMITPRGYKTQHGKGCIALG